MKLVLKLSLFLLATVVLKVNCDSTIEISCHSEEDCKSFVDDEVSSKCMGTCACYLKNGGAPTTCVPKNLKTFNEISKCPCQVVNTECKNDKCVCKNGFIKSEDKLRCIAKTVQLGKHCVADHQCKRFERNSVCKDSICKCVDNFLEVNGTCRSMVVLPRYCDDVKQKCGPNQECINGKCLCNQNDVLSSSSNETCVPYADFGQSCIDDIQCLMGVGNGTKCENNRCVCDGHHSIGKIGDIKICERNVRYLQNCTMDWECEKYFDDPRMWCEKKECRCSEGYRLSDGIHNDCVPMEEESSSSSSASSVCLSLLFIFGNMLIVRFL